MTAVLLLLATMAATLSAAGQSARTVPLTRGMIIERSVTIRPGTYRLNAASDFSRPAITIRGENITVDFAGAVLAGGSDGADPDTFAGVGILIEGGRRITVKNASVRGYKIGVLARRSPDLHLSHNDFSYNWKPRLHSRVEQESLADWMSYHQNDKDEWLRRGAAVYLAECDRSEIDANTILQGQNGVMIARSAGVKIWNNTIQFMSGIGVGLYRTTGSRIMHNRIDWCVRGYSHGFYNRGQDSAGLLMYEQSSKNVVAFNSITHGGDGLFLWAGQSTMDTGQGGSNENSFYGNDFSHAATNGIEATFSFNTFVGNRVEDCWHGVWGGYSYGSTWRGNRFARNTDGIAIEHGLGNTIDGNTFDGDQTAIRLWQNSTQDPTWGFVKFRDTRSHGYKLWGNRFNGNKVALDIRATTGVETDRNRFASVGTKLIGDAAVDPDAVLEPFVITDHELLQKLPDGLDPFIADPLRRGRHRIIVDEWGPYDWKSPKLWPSGRSDENPLTLRVLGPEGSWKLARVRGASATPAEGRVPGEIVVRPDNTRLVDFDVSLEYRSSANDVVSPRGVRTAAGTPYSVSYARYFLPIDWRVQLFEYGDASDPVKQPKGFARLMAGAPLRTVSVDRLDDMSGRSFGEGLPRDRFALRAEGTAALPTGEYVLEVISDDGVRVWMDGAMILDEWTPHESRVSRVVIRGGGAPRRFNVEYYEAGGFAELRFDIQRR